MITGKQTAITLGVTKMNTYRITLEVDEGWLEAIKNLIDVDIYTGETCKWIEIEEITNA